MINTGLLHDAVGCVPRFTICRNSLIAHAIAPNLVRCAVLSDDFVTMQAQYLSHLFVKTIHAA